MTSAGLIEIIPTQRCLDCDHSWPAEYNPMYKDSGTKKHCPKCGSDKLDTPPIKKGGPFDEGSMKHY